jgi:hypothetical protein
MGVQTRCNPFQSEWSSEVMIKFESRLMVLPGAATLVAGLFVAIGIAHASAASSNSFANPAPLAAPATPTEATGSLSTKSTYGTLLDNPVSKAILEKLIPEVVNNPQSQLGRELPLAAIAQFEPTLTAEKLKQIDEALAASAKK